MSCPWPARLAAAVLVLCPAPASSAAEWDPDRASSPASVGELRALQDRVGRVVSKATPTTVGLVFQADGGRTGAGSGVIVRPDGLVLTAGHVILDAESGQPLPEVRVVLFDGTLVRAKPLGVNVKRDSGMVRITDPPPANFPGAKGGKWPAAELAAAAALKEGQWVVSLGHPGGPKKERRPPVRLGRVVRPADLDDAVLITDCTLVGGDSGGPLFDLAGRLVGIHSRIGYLLKANVHVPVESYRDEWDRLAKGEVLGVRSAQPDLGVALDPDADDVRVRSVVPGGPADKAGLKAGDVVTRFADAEVGSADDLIELLDARDPGDRVEVEVRRGGRTLTLTVALGRKPLRRGK